MEIFIASIILRSIEGNVKKKYENFAKHKYLMKNSAKQLVAAKKERKLAWSVGWLIVNTYFRTWSWGNYDKSEKILGVRGGEHDYLSYDDLLSQSF